MIIERYRCTACEGVEQRLARRLIAKLDAELLASGTVEEVIADRLRRKRALAADAIVGVGGDTEDMGDIVAALDRSPLAGNRQSI